MCNGSQNHDHGCALVIFDMDGTLTRPTLDFDAIRREIGVQGPLLEALSLMTESDRRKALAVIEAHEQQAAETSVLYPGVPELLTGLRGAGILTAIATRNSRRSASTVFERHGLTFDHLDTREDGPVKPAPDPVLRTCRRLEVAPRRAWMVGDYVFDLECGRQAGSTTVLMLGDRLECDYTDVADHVVRDLREILPLLGCDHNGWDVHAE